MGCSGVIILFWKSIILLFTSTCLTFTEVSAQGCINGTLRLEGGATSMEGRLQICFNNVWGGLCSNEWDYLDASVACRQLNFSSYGAVSFEVIAYGLVYLGRVRCVGSEDLLTDCPHDNNNFFYCHSFYAETGLRCQPGSFMQNCTENSTRLVGGNSSLEGRVEVCVNGDWGTVTSNSWDYRDASVVCRQLGFSSLGAISFIRAAFGRSTGAIVMDIINCIGNETSLISCSHSIPSGAFQSDDVGVRCKPASYIGCAENFLRVVEAMEGRLEVCFNGDWIPVITSSWDYRDASVACRQLGFSPYGSQALRTNSGQRVNIMVLSNVNCRGSETMLTSCPLSVLNVYYSYYGFAGIDCHPVSFAVTCIENSTRLVGGNSSLEGRVEVCVNGDWGTVTDDSWDYRDASVVCRGLNHSSLGAVPLSAAAFGEGTGAIVLDSVNCRGTESFLTSCPNSIPDDFDYHSEDAGVRCKPNSFVANCTENTTRLVGGRSSLEGRVEVCVNGDWGTVTDDSWDYRDASVVCKELNHSSYGAVALSRATFGEGTGAIVMDSVHCDGQESSLTSCSHRTPSNDYHFEDAGVHCRPGSYMGCSESSLRIVGEPSVMEGRLEVCVNNDWIAVIIYSWDYRDASVACRQLGFSPFGAEAILYRAGIGQNYYASAMGYVNCQGTESTLTSCSSSVLRFQLYFRFAGVSCHPASFIITCTENSTRLVGGNSSLEGRVEVCVNGDWGTVTHDNWDYRDASVVCRELNHSSYGAVSWANAAFGEGTGAIVMDNVHCHGNEASLALCPHFFFPGTNDGHFKDASVLCKPESFVANCTENSVRLVGGNSSLEGRVEVCVNGDWGTVTSDSWDYRDASVVCRQLGFSARGADAYIYAAFGEGTGAIVLDNVRCQGNEAFLHFCSFSIPDEYDSHIKDAGVRCTPGIVVSVPVATIVVDEDCENVSVCVEVSESSQEVFNMSMSTLDGTALSGFDYEVADSTLGEAQCLNITIFDDSVALEGNESFTVVLNTSDSSVTLGNSQRTITIMDNEAASVSVPQILNATVNDRIIQVCATLSLTSISTGEERGSTVVTASDFTISLITTGSLTAVFEPAVDLIFPINSLDGSQQCLNISDVVIEEGDSFTVALTLVTSGLGVSAGNHMTTITIRETASNANNQTEITSNPTTSLHPFESLSLATKVVIYVVALLLALGCVSVSIICPLVLLCWKRRVRNPYMYRLEEDPNRFSTLTSTNSIRFNPAVVTSTPSPGVVNPAFSAQQETSLDNPVSCPPPRPTRAALSQVKQHVGDSSTLPEETMLANNRLAPTTVHAYTMTYAEVSTQTVV